MKKHIYQGVIIALLLFFLIFAVVSGNNYIALIEVTEQLDNALESQRNNYKEIISGWEENYDELLTNYGGLLVERDKLIEKTREVELPIYEYTAEEIYMLAQCVEAEAGHYEAHKLSQKYVTQVILNRLHSGEFPDSIEEVIYQKVNGVPQFSVAYDGAMNREVEPETLANVYSVLVHGTDMPEYVCYFYSEYVTENWVNTLPVYDVVEGTVFAFENKEE